MSLEAMVWALKNAPVTDAQEHLVLIGLADHAGGNGAGAWPSKATLAEYARCSIRTVGNKLKRMESAGIIRRGDQRMVAHIRGDRRPIVYDLNLHGVNEVPVVDGVQQLPPVGDGVQEPVVRGAEPGSHGVQPVADKPSMNRTEPSSKNTPPPAASVAVDGSGDSFDAFWSAYPRKTDKAKARKAFDKAAGSVDAWGVIVRGAERLAADPNLPPAQFIPHPTTWLNGERWDDAPYPVREGARGSTTDSRVEDGLALAARLHAEANGEPHLRAIGGRR